MTSNWRDAGPTTGSWGAPHGLACVQSSFLGRVSAVGFNRLMREVRSDVVSEEGWPPLVGWEKEIL